MVNLLLNIDISTWIMLFMILNIKIIKTKKILSIHVIMIIIQAFTCLKAEN